MSDEVITVYTSDDCIESQQMIRYLDELGIVYIEKSVSEDRRNLKQLQAKNIYSTPALIYGDKIVLGFLKDKIDRLFKKA